MTMFQKSTVSNGGSTLLLLIVLLGNVFLKRYVVFSHPVPQGVRIDSEHLPGAALAVNFSPGQFEGQANVIRYDLIEGWQRPLLFSGGRSDYRGMAHGRRVVA